ncbi:MAG: 2-phospho-L-lactate guanylyltransferase [Caldilineaceae bacterium]
MKLWLIVPVKPFGEGKSRLNQALSIPERAWLSQQMFLNVLQQAKAAAQFAGVLVVSHDPAVLAAVNWRAVEHLPERGYGLNHALEQAQNQAILYGADAILVLPADLPLLTADDINQLVALSSPHHHNAAPPSTTQQATGQIVIAASQDGGTNALLLYPPRAIRFAFGNKSFARHCALAQAAGVALATYHSPTLAFDVDWPQDLTQLSVINGQPSVPQARRAGPQAC